MLSAGASSSSSSSFPLDKYEVFLSFRGSDTREGFTSHLHAALKQKKIKTFIDDKFERGDQISSTLLKAIDESKISVIVFSKNYASSSWCLEELVHIHHCKEKAGQIVVPAFYHVDPSDVRKQHGVFLAAFAELEKRFKDKMYKVQEWRLAMTAIANLSGWDSSVTRPEAQLVEKIVEDILEKLKRRSCGVDLKGLFGIEKRIKSTELLLRIDVHDVRIIGIWGMGGIGKTTLANVVFIKLSSQFESCCFLENVRERWKKGQKKYHLQNKIYRVLLEEENLNKYTQLIRSNYVQDRLRRKRMLLVLDNVDDQEQLDFLIDHDLFGPGSRIIITTRDVQLLKNLATDMYKVERLNPDEALQLFHFHAFKRSSLTRDPYTKLSGRAVNCAAGNPLALKVLGSHFGNKNKEKWERALNELQKFPYNEQVHNVLMTSYDGLDEGQKNMFLDITCFFKGKARDYVERILSCCDISGDTEIDDLIDKSLITITNDNKIEMHDMVQEMGWEIIRQECKNKPGKRSRLWNAQEIYHVLKNNKATAAIQGICLDVSDIGDVHLSPYVFEKMDNLRLLWIFYSKITKKGKVCFDEDLQSLPGNLKYLCWDEYPLKSLPTNFTAESLVELCMPHSQLERLWSGVRCVENLKKIDLSYSKRLIEVPDLSRARKLETIYLEECESLCQVPSYFENLDQLTTLFLAGCSSLSEFPQVPKNIRCLVLCRTAIARVPPSIESLSYLEILCLRYCTLEGLPNISKPKRLKDIELEGTVLKPKRLKDIELEGTVLKPKRLKDIELEGTVLKPKRWKDIELEGTVLKPKRRKDILLASTHKRLKCIELEEKVLVEEMWLELKAQSKDIESKATVLKHKRLNDLLLKLAALKRNKSKELYRLKDIELEGTPLKAELPDWINDVMLNPYPWSWERKIRSGYTFCPRPWERKIRSGYTFCPRPWERKIRSGYTFGPRVRSDRPNKDNRDFFRNRRYDGF